jgi:hypothetical protein
MRDSFWRENPDAPFATLVRVAVTYCHPEADEHAYDDLKVLAARGDREEMVVFKDELRTALRNPAEAPREALSREVQYDDGGPEQFLRRLWRDLYPDDPAPGQA